MQKICENTNLPQRKRPFCERSIRRHDNNSKRLKLIGFGSLKSIEKLSSERRENELTEDKSAVYLSVGVQIRELEEEKEFEFSLVRPKIL